MAGVSQFQLFGERRFMPFFMTQGLGAFNDNIFKNALAALLVFEGSRLAGMNTNQLVNLSALVFILPFFLFSALFGQFADKYEKSVQIRRVKLFEVVIMLLATLGFWLNNIPLLMFVLRQFFEPRQARLRLRLPALGVLAHPLELRLHALDARLFLLGFRLQALLLLLEP